MQGSVFLLGVSSLRCLSFRQSKCHSKLSRKVHQLAAVRLHWHMSPSILQVLATRKVTKHCWPSKPVISYSQEGHYHNCPYLVYFYTELHILNWILRRILYYKYSSSTKSWSYVVSKSSTVFSTSVFHTKIQSISVFTQLSTVSS